MSENNGPYLDHAIYFHDFITRLRTTIAHEKEQVDLEEVLKVEPVGKLDSHLADMEDRLRAMPVRGKKVRAKDKGQMSAKQRKQISQKLKTYWIRRRSNEVKVG